jgi:hypothetical protein
MIEAEIGLDEISLLVTLSVDAVPLVRFKRAGHATHVN